MFSSNGVTGGERAHLNTHIHTYMFSMRHGQRMREKIGLKPVNAAASYTRQQCVSETDIKTWRTSSVSSYVWRDKRAALKLLCFVGARAHMDTNVSWLCTITLSHRANIHNRDLAADF